MKQWVQAVARLPGVRGGSAQGQISRGTWETRPQRSGSSEKHNRRRLRPGVGEAHSSEEVR